MKTACAGRTPSNVISFEELHCQSHVTATLYHALALAKHHTLSIHTCFDAKQAQQTVRQTQGSDSLDKMCSTQDPLQLLSKQTHRLCPKRRQCHEMYKVTGPSAS